MILNVRPINKIQGSIALPTSKSYSIRALIIAACGGRSQLKYVSNCDDAKVALKVAVDLGAKVHDRGGVLYFHAPEKPFVKYKVFNVGESGTSLRFLLPLLPLHVPSALIKGKKTLVGRPNAHLCASLRACGLNIKGAGDKESVPIAYKGGLLKAGEITIDGSLSSQFISALLIAVPRLKGDTRLAITGDKLVSQDYIVMTTQILAKAGIKVKQLSAREYFIAGGQSFKGLKNFCIPADYGLAAFPMAAGALLPSKLVLKGYLPNGLIQSDGRILNFLRAMGVVFQKTDKGLKISGPFNLKGGAFSLKDCPDLVPIMAVMALFARGRTVLADIHHARAKESDRISDLRVELLKVGAKVTETANALIIDPQPAYQGGKVLDAHHDHRLAMAFTVLGLKIGCKVKGIESSHKSYPDFVKDMRTLKALK